ncbi:hypothetical protein ACLF8K_02015 [Helicobacter pylori]
MRFSPRLVREFGFHSCIPIIGILQILISNAFASRTMSLKVNSFALDSNVTD